VDRVFGVPFAPASPPDLVNRARPGITSPDGRDAFVAVCAFARERTATDDVFLVPPEDWDPLRCYGRRGVAVTRKDGGTAMTFLGARGMDWYRDYAEAVRVYATGTPSEWDALAAKWDARYVVADGPVAAPPEWTVAFEAPPFRVLAVPAR
jgi:hypothetical protein